jgi:hypothetical protein
MFRRFKEWDGISKAAALLCLCSAVLPSVIGMAGEPLSGLNGISG